MLKLNYTNRILNDDAQNIKYKFYIDFQAVPLMFANLYVEHEV